MNHYSQRTYIFQKGVKVIIKLKDQHASSMTGGLLTVIHIVLSVTS